MHDRPIRSPDFKPVQLGKRRPDSPGSCGPQFPRLEPAAQTAQTSDIATSPGEPHADAVDERCAATQLSEARARDTCETRTSCLSVPERGIQPTTKTELLSNRPGGELEKRPIIHHLHLLRCAYAASGPLFQVVSRCCAIQRRVRPAVPITIYCIIYLIYIY